jgi:glycosyltransferase involved in cell wall biosynthesis
MFFAQHDNYLELIDSSKKIGIIGYGHDQWVAGTLYIQSLIVGRFLVSGQSAETSLYLHKDFHRGADYAGMSELIENTNYFGYFYGSSFPVTKRLITAWKRYKEGKRPLFPANTLPGLLRKDGIEAIFPANALLSRKYSKAKLICWIPDFQELHFPQYFSFYDRLLRKFIFRKMIKRADRIVVSNQCSYADALKLVPHLIHKFEVLPFTMHLGSKWRLMDPVAVCGKYDVPHEYIMFPSNYWIHKNHLNLFKAILLLRKRGLNINLVTTGLFDEPRFPEHCVRLKDFLESNQLQDQIQILGLLPRTDQIQLMRNARAIIQPSFYEGWSALLEDCRSLGKTVFVSDIEMHREQSPDHAIFFNPESPGELAQCIEEHWETLPEGVDLHREAIGEQKNIESLKAFARKFNNICNAIE